MFLFPEVNPPEEEEEQQQQLPIVMITVDWLL
jgi:hypothetical protein